jgi:hypothetical protein
MNIWRYVRRGGQREVAFCVMCCNTGGKIKLTPSDTPCSIMHSPSPTSRLQQFIEQIAVINFAIGNTSVGIRGPLHKIWRGTVYFSAAAYKIYAITSQPLSISSMGGYLPSFQQHCADFILFLSSFVFHFVPLQQSESDVMYKSEHRCLHSRYWFQFFLWTNSLYTSHPKKNTVTTQNLAFLSYLFGKKRLQMHF